MRTILQSGHNNDRQYAGRVFEGFDISGEWLAIHFNDGTSLLFSADIEYDDSAYIGYQNAAPLSFEDKYGLNLIDRDEVLRLREERDAAKREARRADFERMKAEFGESEATK